ncbi:unnamed protein product [Lampetra planeri]
MVLRDMSLMLLLLLLLFCATGRDAAAGPAEFTNTWAAQVRGGSKAAVELAERHGLTYLGQIFEDYHHFRHHAVQKRSLSRHESLHTRLRQDTEVSWVEQQVVKVRRRKEVVTEPTDPEYAEQWYLENQEHHDLNVVSAWSLGYTGRGSIVSILDDGIEKDHPDLAANYDPNASFDINDNDPDPQPRYTPYNDNRHGTRCAGEVAAAANNNVCGVGIAYNAKIGGVRMLDGDVTDAVEASSLSLRPQHIHIYSASWGPEDDGKTVDGPASLARAAFQKGVAEGRGGLGSIFVWASGNGGRDEDSCNCDGYTNSVYTLSISSATQSGNVPWYSEACSSTLATTYSSGSLGQKQIVTTDLRMRCTSSHTGTSASAPLAAGIIALVLEANPKLTWRDMQHLVVRTSNPAFLSARDWVTNGVGRKVSHSYGYGLLDAGTMVSLATNWTTVGPQRICSIDLSSDHKSISDRLVVKQVVDACRGTKDHVTSLEHVQAKISLTFNRRGDLTIYLTSPAGTRSTLLAPRPHDFSSEGFDGWAFMTTHSWDEDPAGEWTLEIDKGSSHNYGTLINFTLVLYGTASGGDDIAATAMAQTPGPAAQPLSETTARPTGASPSTTTPSSSATPSPTPRAACRQWDDKENCVACDPALLLHQGTCVWECPAGFFASAACLPCHASCAQCGGHSDSDCLSCPPGSELVSGEQRCATLPDAATEKRTPSAATLSPMTAPNGTPALTAALPPPPGPSNNSRIVPAASVAGGTTRGGGSDVIGVAEGKKVKGVGTGDGTKAFSALLTGLVVCGVMAVLFCVVFGGLQLAAALRGKRPAYDAVSPRAEEDEEETSYSPRQDEAESEDEGPTGETKKFISAEAGVGRIHPK